MDPAKLTLTPVVENDTWLGVSSIAIAEDGVPPAAAAASAEMRFATTRKSGDSRLVITSAAGDISIVDAGQWVFSVLPRTPIGLPPGFYWYAFKVTDENNVTQTYLEGQIKVIHEV